MTGTGGTIAGVSSYLKDQNPNVRVFLADPPGSSLYNKVCMIKPHMYTYASKAHGSKPL
jgi:cysteine synthase